jgi:hypothetical protein
VRRGTVGVASAHATPDDSAVPFAEYLSHIDFVLAGVVAIGAGLIFLVINHFLQISSEDVFTNILPGAGRWLGRSAVELAHDEAAQAWFCPACRSLNVPGAAACYHCLRPRPERPRPAPEPEHAASGDTTHPGGAAPAD